MFSVLAVYVLSSLQLGAFLDDPIAVPSSVLGL